MKRRSMKTPLNVDTLFDYRNRDESHQTIQLVENQIAVFGSSPPHEVAANTNEGRLIENSGRNSERRRTECVNVLCRNTLTLIQRECEKRDLRFRESVRITTR
jgi:hypothetical protein